MIKVVIGITTYNLEDYISEALDSILMQKTNFNYKIIIADDCSSDSTIKILKKYKTKYPDLIDLKLSDKNQGSLKNSNRIFEGLQCEYFTFLDGDDYWLGDNHLQKQVDYLDSHPNYMICGANTQYLRNDELSGYVVEEDKCNKSYYFTDLLNNSIPFVHTSAILIRNTIFCNGLPKCYKIAENTFENCALRGEDFRRILHLEKGPMYVMPEIISVYRIHSRGMWQGSSNVKRVIESTISWNFYKKYFNNRYGKFFEDKFNRSYCNMMRTLVVDTNFLNSYELGEVETELITGLLNDLKRNEIKVVKKNRFKNSILKLLLRFIFQ